jgi:hypothetical protein
MNTLKEIRRKEARSGRNKKERNNRVLKKEYLFHGISFLRSKVGIVARLDNQGLDSRQG